MADQTPPARWAEFSLGEEVFLAKEPAIRGRIIDVMPTSTKAGGQPVFSYTIRVDGTEETFAGWKAEDLRKPDIRRGDEQLTPKRNASRIFK